MTDNSLPPFNGFNTQPPEGGWRPKNKVEKIGSVSTHSRPKAADKSTGSLVRLFRVSTHSRPKAAGHVQSASVSAPIVSTHSRPKAAAARCVRQ